MLTRLRAAQPRPARKSWRFSPIRAPSKNYLFWTKRNPMFWWSPKMLNGGAGEISSAAE
jgi:hypothetical protein